jgi:hypothetical protein
VHLSKEEKAKDLASISASGEIKISKYDQKRFFFHLFEDLNFLFLIFRVRLGFALCNVPLLIVFEWKIQSF